MQPRKRNDFSFELTMLALMAVWFPLVWIWLRFG